MSENKTSKYFKYAIGEIILVVIGILIALQINNWNENRKLENSKQKLMLAIKKELTINKNTQEKYITEIHKSNSKFNKVLLFSVGKYQIPADSLRHYLSKMIYDRTLYILNSVQEEAINSGKFEMLSDSLKQNLSILKDYTNSRNSFQNTFFEVLNFDNDPKMDQLVAELLIFPVIPDDLVIHPLIPLHPEFLLNDLELSDLVKKSETYLLLNKIYMLYAGDEIWVKQGLYKMTTKTIELIDKELNKL